jgi:chaperone required for assembly of F1-ATPase
LKADKYTRNLIVLMSLMALIALLITLTADEYRAFPHVASKTTKVKTSPLMSKIIDGIRLPTRLIASQNFELVVRNGTSCYSPKLITQNHQIVKGWKSIIEWMQEKQNLWNLGKAESKIIEYLAKNYDPKNERRRRNLNLKNDDWYVLE